MYAYINSVKYLRATNVYVIVLILVLTNFTIQIETNEKFLQKNDERSKI